MGHPREVGVFGFEPKYPSLSHQGKACSVVAVLSSKTALGLRPLLYQIEPPSEGAGRAGFEPATHGSKRSIQCLRTRTAKVLACQRSKRLG